MVVVETGLGTQTPEKDGESDSGQSEGPSLRSSSHHLSLGPPGSTDPRPSLRRDPGGVSKDVHRVFWGLSLESPQHNF